MLVRVDFYYPAANLVVEVLGYRWHKTPAHLDRDTRRMNAIINTGRRVLQFTYGQLREDRAMVIATIRDALDLTLPYAV